MKTLARSAAGAFIAGSLCYGSGSWAEVLPFDENVPPGIAISGADAIVGDPGPPSTRPSGPVRGEYIVVFEDTVSDARGLANAIARGNGIVLDHVYENAIKGFSARMPEVLAQMLASDPSVASVEQNQYVQELDIVPGVERIGILNNTGYPLSYDLDGQIDPDTNDCSHPSSECADVDVAVIDGGIDPNHPDLNVHQYVSCIGQSIIPQGCGAPDTNENDIDHGTHVAGTIGAVDDGVNHETFEVVGVAPGARIWAVKVLQNGSGTLADINAGIDYVTAHSDEIEVANMSLGFSGCASPSMQAAIANSVAAGVVYVVSAGNSMSDIYGANGQYDTPSRNPFRCSGDDFQPAAYPEAMAVSAMYAFDGVSGGNATNEPTWTYSSGGQTLCVEDNGDDTMACFSNFSANVTNNNPVTSPGKAIDIAGPGVDVLSTVKGGYGRKHGTSMSSPHVAGAVALYIVQNGLAPSNADDVYGIRQDLINSAEAQTSWGPADTEDPDGFEEGLVNVATGGGSSDNPPSVTITDPAPGATVSSVVTVTADASDDNSVTQVEFFVGGTSIGVDTNGGDGWSASWDTTAYSDGGYTVSATATDDASPAQTGSDSITVSVDNSGGGALVTLDLSTASINNGRTWEAQVTISVVSGDASEQTVSGTWTGGASGSGSCPISGTSCTVQMSNIRKNQSSVTFTVDTVGGGTDFDGETSITVFKP